MLVSTRSIGMSSRKTEKPAGWWKGSSSSILPSLPWMVARTERSDIIEPDVIDVTPFGWVISIWIMPSTPLSVRMPDASRDVGSPARA